MNNKEDKEMFKKELLNKLFIENETDTKYILLDHGDKTWVMPEENLKTALEMYQPSTMKGKILKSCIRLFHASKILLKKIGCQKKNLSFHPDILSYLQKTMNEQNIYIAAYMGDTSAKQNNKITLQVYNHQRILCYAKVSEEPEVLENFSREIGSINYLEKKGVTNIPKILGDEEIQGLRIFVQSTNKPLKQQVRLKLGREQIEFIDKIVNKTKQDTSYEESQFYNSIQYLKSVTEQFQAGERTTINNAIDMVENAIEKKKIEFAFNHGDYTPWNVYYSDGELNVFDFEYCSDTMPSYIDVFHYMTQMSILGLKNDVRKTIHFYNSRRKLLEQYIPDADFTYLCYLISIISFYKKRTEDGTKSIDDKYDKWIGIMAYLNDKLKLI